MPVAVRTQSHLQCHGGNGLSLLPVLHDRPGIQRFRLRRHQPRRTSSAGAAVLPGAGLFWPRAAHALRRGRPRRQRSPRLQSPVRRHLPHVPDMAIAAPTFHGERLVAFAASVAHKADMGGERRTGGARGQAMELLQEGTFPFAAPQDRPRRREPRPRTPDRRQLARARTGAGRHAGPARSHRTTTCRGAVPPGGRLRRDDEGRHRRVGPKFQGGDRPPARGRTRLGGFLDSDSVDHASDGAPGTFFLHTSRQRQTPSSFRASFAPRIRFSLRTAGGDGYGGPEPCARRWRRQP